MNSSDKAGGEEQRKPDASERFWLDRHVFVTGATGLLGSWVVQKLLERRANVVVLMRDTVGPSLFFERRLDQVLTVVHGELEDYLLLERSLNEHEIDTVFHLGAQTIVTIANRSPLSTFEANIRGTYNLLEAIRRTRGVSRTIVASSDKAYGESLEQPYVESSPLAGRHPYDVSKSCADLIASAYHHTYGLPLCVTRCGNLFGPGDLNYNRIVPGTIRSALYNQRPVIRSDASPIREYFYVEDAALAYIHLAEKMDREGIPGQAFNFGSESPLNVREIVDKVLKAVGREDLEPEILGQSGGEIQVQSLSTKKARDLLDWTPSFSLESGLEHSIAWYRKKLIDSLFPS